jgi:hypothetical protein
MPDYEQAEPTPDHDPGIGGNTARVFKFDLARVAVRA